MKHNASRPPTFRGSGSSISFSSSLSDTFEGAKTPTEEEEEA